MDWWITWGVYYIKTSIKALKEEEKRMKNIKRIVVSHRNNSEWEVKLEKEGKNNLSYLSQICLGVEFSSRTLVSVVVPYSSVPHMYKTL